MDFYKQHLAAVSENQTVTAREPIFTSQGQLLIPKGKPIDESNVDRIIKFKLQKPVEETLVIESEYTSETLYTAISDYMCSSPDFLDLFVKAKTTKAIKICCEFSCQHRLLRQKITILKLKCPHTFDQTLFVAWFAANILLGLGRTQHEANQVFMAALLRDLGRLHVDPSIFQIKGKLNPEQARQLHSHPIISAKIAEGIPNLNPALLRGILEHHENVDGTGFPQGKKASELNEYGQVLNMLDSTLAIYEKSCRPLGRTLADTLPVIQMNSRPQIQAFYNQLLMMIKTSPSTTHTLITASNVGDIVKQISQVYLFIDSFIKNTSLIINEFVKANVKSKKLSALQKGYLHIHQSITQSGLINEAYMRWLAQVAAEKIEMAYREVEDAVMMLRELRYQITKFSERMSQFVITEEDNARLPTNVPVLLSKIIAEDCPALPHIH